MSVNAYSGARLLWFWCFGAGFGGMVRGTEPALPSPHGNAAASAPRNIAEGFGRFVPRDFSQYLRIANGSLMETSNRLQDGCDRGYFKPADIEDLQILARRASAAVTGLIRYLQRSQPPNPGTRRTSREPRTHEPKTPSEPSRLEHQNRNQNQHPAPEHQRTRAPREVDGPVHSTRLRIKHFR